MQELDKLKLRLGILDTSKDSLLQQLLEDAEAQILDFTNRKILVACMQPLKRELAIVYYNQQGDEGIASRNEGAISVSYNQEIPQNIQSRLKQYRLLKIVGVANESKE